MTTDAPDSLAAALFRLWTQAKVSPRYVEGPWLEFHAKLVAHDLGERGELQRYRKIGTLIREAILEHDENVPRGTV